MAVTANQLLIHADNERAGGLVAASTTLYQATLAFINSGGYLASVTNGGSNEFAGVVVNHVDNSAGSNGDKAAVFYNRGVFTLPGSGFSQATVGSKIYASDNYTVTTTAAGNTFIGRCTEFVSSTLIKVEINGRVDPSDYNITGVADDTDLEFGDSQDVVMLFSTGDASNHTFVVGLDNTSQQMHITDKGAKATDWDVAAATHPEVYIHSNTTPATDYLKIGAHDGTTCWITAAGATSIKLGHGALETLILETAADAVNEVTITPAATGAGPIISATGGDTNVNLVLTPKGAGYVSATSGVQVSGDAVTATTGGGTTGLIPAGASFVTVTSDDANKQISLPAASVGHVIRIKTGATGCELISAVADHEVNDVVVGATNELALAADHHFICEYVAANKWIVRGFTKLGADHAALVPDAR